MIHYGIEYDDKGIACRLTWSSARQAAGEAAEREWKARQEREAAAKAQTMSPEMDEWKRRHQSNK